MEQPQIRLGNDEAWLELTRISEDAWRVAADWGSWLTADFTAHLSAEEVVDFAERTLLHLYSPWGGRAAMAMTPGRNNPLTLQAEPVGDGFAFVVRLTPNGHDTTCQLQMEIDPIAAPDLREAFHVLHAALVD